MDTSLSFDFFVIGYMYSAIAYVFLVLCISSYQALSLPDTNDEFYSQVKDLLNPSSPYSIDVSECIGDITSNHIANSTEHYQLPAHIFENAVFEALNDLVDDFAQDPDRFLNNRHTQQIDSIAQDYLNSWLHRKSDHY